MSLKIISQTEKPLLSRVNVKAEILFEKATPTNEEVRKQLASALKKDENLIVIKKIKTAYGLTQADVEAHVYDTVDAKVRVEPKPKKPKEGAAPKKEEKKAE